MIFAPTICVPGIKHVYCRMLSALRRLIAPSLESLHDRITALEKAEHDRELATTEAIHKLTNYWKRVRQRDAREGLDGEEDELPDLSRQVLAMKMRAIPKGGN